MAISVVDIIFAAIGVFLLRQLTRARPPAPYPPGPRAYPFIGNLLDMPTQQEWKLFSQWGQVWGDIMSVNVLGQTMVILNSPKLAVDMLERKSSIYSDRPTLTMGGEIVGWKNTLVLTGYGDRFRSIRKMFHSVIGTKALTTQFLPVEERETRRFLKRVLSKPEEIAEHIRWTAGSIILQIAYGYIVKDEADPIVDIVEKATEQFSLATAPGAFLVDIIPALRHIPDWVPGAGWKKKAANWGKTLNDMTNVPLDFVKRQIAAGIAPPSFTQSLLEGGDVVPEEETTIKWAAASLYSGGADTTVSAIYTFYLAMTLYPEAQKRAHAEIDAVIGCDRLPTFADREHLPYVEALVKEVLRWNPVTPLGVPHRVTEDDVHEGYYIPKGSLVIANIWQILHDPRTYSNPLEFDPGRFLKAEPEEDPRSFCFGFGRRICPGMNLADASIFISCAMSLAAFDIAKVVDASGNVLEPVLDNTSGTISHPKPFPCSIKPRSPKAEALIRSIE
ncbi:cytochrome P450 [Gloeophyllum trabeum ATCC 11539]|uniref:Cytochrome P450 n=1 Tax=Gloeophyllum trabeum (strain ATCC 11539 / FP-39264 / Madison 617) TaxID=670483 RepID=S7QIZ3_GLOTA|nr:cytochrome P450 [Gloeophyllum trabeum ATCC 11539]EPQ59616.1 cytochrome P450 [Gloeophyllum trabeum ATCC 11539]